MPKFDVKVRIRVKADSPDDARYRAVLIVHNGVMYCGDYDQTTFKALKHWDVRGARRVRKSRKGK